MHFQPEIPEPVLKAMRKEAAAEEVEWLARKKDPAWAEDAGLCRGEVKFWQTRLRALKLCHTVQFEFIGRLPKIPPEFIQHYLAMEIRADTAIA